MVEAIARHIPDLNLPRLETVLFIQFNLVLHIIIKYISSLSPIRSKLLVTMLLVIQRFKRIRVQTQLIQEL
jgi:hypothetical protein